MRLHELMSTPVETIPADLSIAEARARMRLQRIRHLVVTARGDVVGVLSAGDLRGARGDDVVASIMNDDVVTATPTNTVRQAANLLRGRGIGCLPILDRKRVVGIVTITDLLDLLGRGAERPIAKSTRWTLKGRGPRRPRPLIGQP